MAAAETLVKVPVIVEAHGALAVRAAREHRDHGAHAHRREQQAREEEVPVVVGPEMAVGRRPTPVAARRRLRGRGAHDAGVVHQQDPTAGRRGALRRGEGAHGGRVL